LPGITRDDHFPQSVALKARLPGVVKRQSIGPERIAAGGSAT
jgi:hypothetical protein